MWSNNNNGLAMLLMCDVLCSSVVMSAKYVLLALCLACDHDAATHTFHTQNTILTMMQTYQLPLYFFSTFLLSFNFGVLRL